MSKITIPAPPTTANKSVNDWLETLRSQIQTEVDKLDALDDYAIAQAEAAVQSEVNGYTLAERATQYMQQKVDEYASDHVTWGGVENIAYARVAALYSLQITAFVKGQYETWMNAYIETARATALSFCGDFMNDVKAFIAGSSASQKRIISEFNTTIHSDGSITVSMDGIKIIRTDGTVVTTDHLEITIPQNEIVRPSEVGGEGNLIMLWYNTDGVCKIEKYSYNSNGTILYRYVCPYPLGTAFWGAGIKGRVSGGTTLIAKEWWVGYKPRFGFEWDAVEAGGKWWAPYGENVTQNYTALLKAAEGNCPTIAEGYQIAQRLKGIGYMTPFIIGETFNGTLTPAVMIPADFPTMRAFVEGTDSLQMVIRVDE